MSVWVSAAFSLDSRGLTTLRRLMFQPGRLSRDYFIGRRSAVFSPFQIFVLVTLAFFLLPDNYDILKTPARWMFPDVMPLVEAKMAARGLRYDELSILYDSRVGSYSKLGLIVLIGALALGSWMIGRWYLREFGKHFVIMIHNVSFVLALFLAVIPLAMMLSRFVPSSLTRGIVETGTVGIAVLYFVLSQRRTLGLPVWRAAVHGVLLFTLLVASVFLYRRGISLFTLWSL